MAGGSYVALAGYVAVLSSFPHDQPRGPDRS
jgi:hypothetical protein